MSDKVLARALRSFQLEGNEIKTTASPPFEVSRSVFNQLAAKKLVVEVKTTAATKKEDPAKDKQEPDKEPEAKEPAEKAPKAPATKAPAKKK